jgi:ribonuclease BN (tRNA processing enzyme)
VNEETVFDLGPGSLRNLRNSGLKPDNLSEVFISHFHTDHISDLVPFLWAVQIDGRRNPLQVYGPPGFKRTVQKLFECTCTPPDFFKFPLTFSELEFGQRTENVQTCGTVHSIPTLAFRIESHGKSLCYSADTTYSQSVVELARNTDLLVHEATFLEDQLKIAELTKHSTARMAGQVGRNAHSRRLVLFHIPPPNEHRESDFRAEATGEYGSEVQLGTDLAAFEV